MRLPSPLWEAPKLAVRKPVNLIGLVIGTQNRKTAKVRVARHLVHPVVKKIITRHKNYLCHDEQNRCMLGDIVRIQHCGKISKMKQFAVAEVLKGGERYTGPGEGPSNYHMNKGSPPGLEDRVKGLLMQGKSYITPKARECKEERSKDFAKVAPQEKPSPGKSHLRYEGRER